jgi:hypothetical protein
MLASFVAYISLVVAASGLTMLAFGIFGIAMGREHRKLGGLFAISSLPQLAAILIPRAVGQTFDNLLFGTATGLALGMTNMYAIGYGLEVLDRRRRERLAIGESIRPPGHFPRGWYIAIVVATLMGWPLSLWL